MNARGSETAARRRRTRLKDVVTFALFAGPNFVLLAMFTFRPLLYSAWVSLTSWRLPGTARAFVGFENYLRLLKDEEFWRVLANTAAYAIAVVLIAQSIAFALAIALNRQRRGAAVFRFLVFTPHVTLGVAASIAWLLLLDPHAGPAAPLYSAMGVEGPQWLNGRWLSLTALGLVGVWKEIGFATLFFLAGLQALPPEPYEAARLEGLPRWREVLELTIPLMTPVIFFLGVSGVVAAFKTFDTVAVMTQGGPVYPDSSLMVYHLYRTGFRDFEIGYASALANVLWLVLLVFAGLQARGARRWVTYE